MAHHRLYSLNSILTGLLFGFEDALEQKIIYQEPRLDSLIQYFADFFWEKSRSTRLAFTSSMTKFFFWNQPLVEGQSEAT